ncbi:hypothetical protein [Empedobacter tilapiae]
MSSEIEGMLQLNSKGNMKVLESFYDDSVKLSDHLQKRKKTILFIQALKLKHRYTRGQIVQLAVKHSLDVVGEKISQSTAYREYDFAMKIFGDTDDVQIRGEIAVAKDLTYKKFIKADKVGDEEMALKWYKEWRALFPKDVGELKDYDPDKLEKNNYEFSLSKKTDDALAVHLNSGVVDFNKFGVTDVDCEVLKDDDKAKGTE